MVELVVPGKIGITEENLILGVVGLGYREFGRQLDKAGSCNIDVVCAEGDLWREEIRAEAVYSFGGSTMCSGSMINNTSRDARPLFLTAHHCDISAANQSSVVVYWNFQSENCGDLGGGTLDQFTTGSTVLADYAASDMTLIELDSSPDPAFGVTFAGWDRTDTAPPSAVAIHSPGADEKCISFEDEQTNISSYLNEASPGNSTHLRIDSWNLGTTEPGSSGSPLFNPNHRIVGQLHGGWASCTRDTSDFYGRLFVSWTGGGTAATSLSNWLDPSATGVTVLDTYDPAATGLGVTPYAALVSAGDVGGPFSPGSQEYTLENKGEAALNYSVTTNEDWLSISPGTGSLASGATVLVTVSINAAADTMAAEFYEGSVEFANTTTGEGNATRDVELTVGQRSVAVSFNMDENPGWDMEGDWAWGTPLGQGGEPGGEHGSPDPTSGATGSNVLGYNLQGDYDNDMAATHVTTEPINCTGLSDVRLRFQRWLGVESVGNGLGDYDHAVLAISTNGSDFHTLWENSAELIDSSWTAVEYDISDYADDNATVTLRWTIGPTDGTWVYCGWNIDDVQLWAFGEVGEIPGPTVQLKILSTAPNPFLDFVTILYECDSITTISARVLNLQGYTVANLGTQTSQEGENTWSWNGETTAGARLPAGLYFFELSYPTTTEHTTVVHLH